MVNSSDELIERSVRPYRRMVRWFRTTVLVQSQKEFASKAGVAGITVWRYENQPDFDPHVNTKAKIETYMEQWTKHAADFRSGFVWRDFKKVDKDAALEFAARKPGKKERCQR